MREQLIVCLPSGVTDHILSYLYFSFPLSKHIESVNNSIKNYKHETFLELLDKYTIKTINYFILLFFLYDKFNSEKHNLDYDIMDTSYHSQYQNIIRLFDVLSLIEVRRLYNFICYNGGSSETYIH